MARILTPQELEIFFDDKYCALFLTMYEAKINYVKIKQLSWEIIQTPKWYFDKKPFFPSHRLQEMVKCIDYRDFKSIFFIQRSALNMRIASVLKNNNIDPKRVSTHSFKQTAVELEKLKELAQKFGKSI